MGQVVRDMEANLNVINCQNPPCPLRQDCTLKSALHQAGLKFLEVLDQVTLTDITGNQRAYRQLLNIPH